MMLITVDHAQARRIDQDLHQATRLFDFTYALFGADLLDHTAYAIEGTLSRGLDPDGTPFPPLGLIYEAWKNTFFPGQSIGTLTGHMAAMPQIKGVRTIRPLRASMTYGVDARAKAVGTAFQEGGAVTGHPQPPRHFYYLGSIAVAAADRTIETHFQKWPT